MIEKWEKSPTRLGLVIGFFAVPILNLLQGHLIYLAFGFGSGSASELIIRYLVVAAIPGAILGAGLSNGALAARRGNHSETKRHLLCSGGAVALVFSLLIAVLTLNFVSGASSQAWIFGFPIPSWLLVPLGVAINLLPFQIAFLMLFIGILMRPRR